MDKFFGNLHAVLGTGLVLAIVLMLCLNGQNFEDGVAAGNAIMRWLHTFFGVLWIGLLYYFNFVQMPTMPKIPAELKAGVSKHIAPAALFWAVTLYNITDGTMVETPQLMPSINSLSEAVAKNGDGSIDLWFGPSKPADAPDTNFIQTVNGRNFIATVRLYGTGVEFFDQTWKPDDVVKVQ